MPSWPAISFSSANQKFSDAAKSMATISGSGEILTALQDLRRADVSPDYEKSCNETEWVTLSLPVCVTI